MWGFMVLQSDRLSLNPASIIDGLYVTLDKFLKPAYTSAFSSKMRVISELIS